jgi:hypothetical protein
MPGFMGGSTARAAKVLSERGLGSLRQFSPEFKDQLEAARPMRKADVRFSNVQKFT